MKWDNSGGSAAGVLGLIGSQRKLGNCELFVKEVSRRIPIEHDLRLIRLPSLDIRPCNGCYRCVAEGTCATEDDVRFLVDQITRCEALIIAAPVYFLGAHSSVKSFLDRAFSFFGSLEKTKGKPCLLVSIYGMRDRIGTAPQTLGALASFLGLAVKGSASLQAALPGDVLRSKTCIETASRFGSLLFGDGMAPRARRSCPFCGCDIVRIRKTGFACTLCHGSFSLDKEGFPKKNRPGWEMGNAEFIRTHREWLGSMKARFMAERRERVARALPYKDIGTWVEPDK